MAGYPSVRVHESAPSNGTQREAVVHASFGSSVFVTSRGLRLPKRMPFDKWVGIGSYLSNIFSSSAWCLGDWLVYGEAAFNGRYRDAIELTSLDYQTLRNHAWVARRFPMACRRDALSFTHHAEVAALAEPERDFWLRKAEEYGWSAKHLRREVKASLLERTTGNDQEAGESQLIEDGVTLPPEDTVLLRVPISADRLESCHAAASRLGLNVETWAGQILLKAAGANRANATAVSVSSAGHVRFPSLRDNRQRCHPKWRGTSPVLPPPVGPASSPGGVLASVNKLADERAQELLRHVEELATKSVTGNE